MQIFRPYPDYQSCAKSLDDIRLRVQLKESAQILSTSIRKVTNNIEHKIYKSYNKNGRFVKWCSLSKYAFLDLLNYSFAISEEYEYRFDKAHKSIEIVKNCKKYIDEFPEKGYDKYEGCNRCDELTDTGLSIYDAYKIILLDKWENDKIKITFTKTKKPNWRKDDIKERTEQKIEAKKEGAKKAQKTKLNQKRKN
jgi:hypothetical protein